MTDNTDSKERANFEAWYITSTRASLPSAGDGWSDDQIRDSFMGLGTSGKYRSSSAQIAWEGWMARSSLAANAGSEPVARADSWTNDQWIDLAVRHANADWNSDTPDGYLNAVKALCNDFAESHPSPPEGMVGGWRPIETAPEGQMVVVGWLDLEDAEHPERHDFDLLEDGCWQQWHERAEHVEVIGGHGVSYTPPYTVWMPVSPIPTSSADSRKGE